MKDSQWLNLNRVLVVVILLFIAFTWLDVQGNIPFHILDSDAGWQLYTHFIQSGIFSIFYWVFAGIALIWYIIMKDKSEALILFLVPSILLLTGVEDILFYQISGQEMPECMEWLNDSPYISFVSVQFGEDCVSPKLLGFSALTGLALSWASYKYLSKR